MNASLIAVLVSMLRDIVPPTLRVYDTDASAAAGVATAYPYLVVSGGVPTAHYDTVGACANGSSGLARVTHVALTPEAVRALVASTRAVLDRQHLPVLGGDELVLEAHQDVDVDRDVRLVAADSTTSWPYFAVDVYRLGSSI